MKIQRSETGAYFVEPVCDEEVRFMDALMAAVDAFEKAYYPMDTAEGEITTVCCTQADSPESNQSQYQGVHGH